MKLTDLPVLMDVFTYLGDDEVLDVGLVSKGLHLRLTMEPGMKNFWYTQLRRMAHKNMDHAEAWIHLDVARCYPHVDISNFPRTLKKVREQFGECVHDSHLRFKIKLPDMESGGFHKDRDVYNEWKTVAWKRMRHKYWNFRDDKKMKKAEEEVAAWIAEVDRLSKKKAMSEIFEKKYAHLTTKTKKRKSKNALT